MKKIFFLLILSANFLTAQNWFPLEIGNRWDYLLDCHIHGGIFYYDTLSIKIIDKQILSNNIEYYMFLNAYPFWHPSSYYVRYQDSKIYFYDEDDSIDCLAFRFDLTPNTVYYDCKGRENSILFINTSYTFTFQDTVQAQNLKTFSKKFGLRDDWLINGLVECRCELRGCIISGTVYGQLLLSFENDIDPSTGFSVSQNYPNPFNPSTRIQYQVSSNSHVTLKVYDVLGNEVATLVNEYKPAGSYEIKFSARGGQAVNGRQLASGIYFYRLKAGEFVETKKMILLR